MWFQAWLKRPGWLCQKCFNEWFLVVTCCSAICLRAYFGIFTRKRRREIDKRVHDRDGARTYWAWDFNWHSTNSLSPFCVVFITLLLHFLLYLYHLRDTFSSRVSTRDIKKQELSIFKAYRDLWEKTTDQQWPFYITEISYYNCSYEVSHKNFSILNSTRLSTTFTATIDDFTSHETQIPNRRCIQIQLKKGRARRKTKNVTHEIARNGTHCSGSKNIRRNAFAVRPNCMPVLCSWFETLCVRVCVCSRVRVCACVCVPVDAIERKSWKRGIHARSVTKLLT